MIWNDIALKHKTDKSTSFSKMQPIGHGYMATYQLFLEHKRVNRVLEIGVDEGNSLRMWAEIFPDSEIVGLDNNPFCYRNYGDRIKVELVDARIKADLKLIETLYAPFDLIIDDASHKKEDVLFALDVLFSTLSPDGVYVIEDVYWDEIGKELEGWASGKGVRVNAFPSMNSKQSIIFIEKMGDE